MADYEYEYSNGANGSCQDCGGDTLEPWHAYCPDCYAEQQGWRRPDRDALEDQHEHRQTVSQLRLIERVATIERQVVELTELAASLASRLEIVEMHGPVTARRYGDE